MISEGPEPISRLLTGQARPYYLTLALACVAHSLLDLAAGSRGGPLAAEGVGLGGGGGRGLGAGGRGLAVIIITCGTAAKQHRSAVH